MVLIANIFEHLRQFPPIPASGRLDQSGPVQDRRLVVFFVPLPHLFVRPGRVFVLVAEVAGVGGFVFQSGSRGRRQHGVVAAPHPGKFRHGHVAGNTGAGGAGFVQLMVDMGRGLVHPLLMAGEAGLVGRGRIFKLVAPAGGVAVQAGELSRLNAGAEQPGGQRVVFPQVPAVRVVIRVFQGHQIKVVEEAGSR